MSESEKHLSPEEIDRLSQSRPSDASTPPLSDSVEELRRHLAGCASCQTLVSMSEDFDRQLGALKQASATGPTSECPTEDELRHLVVGTLALAREEEVTDHVTTCAHCAPLVRQAAEDLGGGPDAEEMLIGSQLKSADAAWQSELARKMSAPAQHPDEKFSKVQWISGARPARRSSLPGWLYAAASIVIVLGAALAYMLARKPSVDRLLAQAYTEQRPMDLRLAGAAPAPIRQQRGASGSSLSRPASLLEADLQIKRALQRAPNDANWLASQGRSELLEWRYDDAIKSFERALESDPNNPDVLRDLATAHFQRAEAETRAVDYGTAIDELSQALAKRPNDSVALFNRAIVFEKMFLYQDALRDWEKFLKVEPNGPWTTEARERLNELQARLGSHGQLQRTPNSEEITAIPVLRGRLDDHKNSGSAADALDEEYLEIATTRWLHDFADDLRSPSYSSESRSTQALQLLSKILEMHHGDHMLDDLLVSFRNPNFPKAADLLSESISSDLRGDPVAAYEQARRAARLFEVLGNKAAALRAKVEAVYALQRTLKSAQCLKDARFLERDLDVHTYPWMQARTFLEKGSCAAITTGFDDAQRAAIRAGEIATNAGYESLVLRSLSLRSDIAQDKGDSGLCWQVDRQGLERYWSGSFPILRAYAFYADLGYAAESENRWNLAAQEWKEAVPLISQTQNRSTEGLARYRLATDEIAADDYREAQDELQRVAAIFRALPQDQANKNYRVASDVSLASVELDLRHYASAQRLLSEVGPHVLDVSQYPTVLQYFETLAEIQVHSGDLHRAEDNFRIAIAIADKGRTSLKDDRDRAGWEQLTDRGYRDLLELCLRDAHRQTEALSVWEYSRSAPSLEHGGNDANKTPLQIDFQALSSHTPSPEEADIDHLRTRLTSITMLTYVQLSDGLAIWAFDDRGLVFRQISAPPAESEKVSRRFARLCSDPSSDTSILKQDARLLHAWLIAPIESFLTPTRTLWIEPDGIISLVPFQALMDAKGRYLADQFALAMRSGTSEDAVIEPRVTNEDRILLVETSHRGQSISREVEPLPGARREIQEVGSRFRHPQFVTDPEVDSSFLQGALAHAAVFHYAGHYAPDDSSLAGVPWAREFGRASAGGESRSLSPGDLRRCKLVVLSACSTGFGARLGLFDPDGLVRPLLRAGVRRVIASRWDVDSKVTEQLMDAFYAALLAGNAPTAALREAALQLKSNPNSDHPYYWAGFEVFAQN